MTSIDSGNTSKQPQSIACIACDSQKLICWGELPVYTADFLGRDLNSNVNPGELYECENCTLRFRAPQPGKEELMTYYQGLDTNECWQHGTEREVWRYIKDELKDLPAPSVLDVGCFRGEMLSYAGDGLNCFGVEPSKEAGREAEKRGVTIIADNIESLRADGPHFGAISLIDVAEHLLRPLDSLKVLTQLLVPGGKLIIFTGSTDALTWRLAGVDYYYSAMPEHVAFMRPSWFYWAAARLSLDLVSIRRLRYQSSPLRNRIDEGLKNLLYFGYRRLQRLPFLPTFLFKLPGVRRIGEWPGCWWTSAKDHTLVILTKI
jgi:SAM-dependent methyltransferase